MTVKFIDCIQKNSNLSEDLKKRILLQAGVDIKKIKDDPNYIVDDKKVIQAIDNLKKNKQREKYEKAIDLVKLNDITSRIDSFLETTKGKKIRFGAGQEEDAKIMEFLLSSLDANISGNITGKQLGATVNDYAYRYKRTMGNKLGSVLRRYSTYSEKQRAELSKGLVYMMDNNMAKIESITDPKVKKDLPEFFKAYKEAEIDKIDLMNEAGIIIDPIDDYFFKTTHDEIKIGQSNKEEYKAFIKEHVDMQKTHTPDGVSAEDIGFDEFFDKFYDSIILRNDKTKDPFKTTGGGKSILRNEQNQERLLFFKNAESAYEYKMKYGKSDDLMGELFSSIERDSFNYGLSSKFGGNPERNINILLNHYSDKLSASSKSNIEGVFNFSTGESRSYSNPISHNIARIGKNLKMGGIMGKTFFTSYILDPVSLTKTLQQRGIQSSFLFPINYAKNIVAISNRMKKEKINILDKSPEERLAFEKDIASFEGFLNNNSTAMRYDGTMDNFSLNNIQGKTKEELIQREKWDRWGDMSGRIPDILFKVTGQTRFQRMAKDFSSISTLNRLESHKNISLEEMKNKNSRLHNFLTNTMDLSEQDWNSIRSLDEINLSEINNLESDVAVKLNKGLYEVQALSIQEASKRVSSLGYRNQRNRDGVSVFMDLFLQLKSFIMQAMPNLMRRYNYEKQFSESIGDNANMARVKAAGEVASFVVAGMAGAYLVTSAKAIVANETPPDEEFFTGEESLGNMVGLLSVAGGLGIVLDILSFDNEGGKSILDAFAGPILGDASNILSGGLEPYRLTNTLKSYIPFNNAWFADYAAKELIFNNIKKMADEEKFNRGQKYKYDRMRDTGQEQLIDF